MHKKSMKKAKDDSAVTTPEADWNFVPVANNTKWA